MDSSSFGYIYPKLNVAISLSPASCRLRSVNSKNHAIKPPWCMMLAHWHEYDGCIVWLVPLLELCSCGDISIWNCIVKSFFSSQGHVSELAWKISSLHFFSPSVINERGVMKITIFFIASRYPWKKKIYCRLFFWEMKMYSTLHFNMARMLWRLKLSFQSGDLKNK